MHSACHLGKSGTFCEICYTYFQAEASAQTPISYGDAVMTGPGSLPCRAIFHGACLAISDSKCEQVTCSAFVLNCI